MGERTAGGWKWWRAAEIASTSSALPTSGTVFLPRKVSLPRTGLEAQVGGLEVPSFVEGRGMIWGVPGVDVVAKGTTTASGGLGDGGVELLGSYVGRARGR